VWQAASRMGGDASDLVKLGVAVTAGALVLKYVWRALFSSQDQQASASKQEQSAASAEAKTETSLQDGVWIYFGSQSGTAQGFSEELAEECTAHDLKATVVDMEDFDEEDFKQHRCVVVVVATYGEGDPTDNAVEFFKWIQDQDLAEDTLKGMSFTVMGLGNRQYVNFNSCGKTADARLEQLGASRIYVRGEGDDDQNIEEDFEQWKGNGLWPALRQAMGVDEGAGAANEKSGNLGLESSEEVLGKLQLKAVVSDAKAAPVDPMVQVGGADIFGKWYFSASLAPVSMCEELRQKPNEADGKTTKHIEFDVKHFPALDWRTADNLEVLPRNSDEDVEWFAKRFDVAEEIEQSVNFVRANGVDKAVRKPFPTPCSVRTALALYCDLASIPAKAAARRFAAFARDESEREVLERLTQDREAYQWLSGEGIRLCLREFFELFLTSAEIDFSAFLQLCPRQKNRPYTIASSSREDPHTIGICVSMVQEKLESLSGVIEGLTKRGHAPPRASQFLQQLTREADSARCFRGLCSTGLCTRIQPGEKLWIAARASSFRLPRRSTTPIVMIAAGTGLAPMRAFLREFRAEKGVRTKTLLFFGCQHSDKDFIYREEMEEALKSEPPALKELVTAFSREQEEKVYVQHRVHERAAEIAELIKEGAYVYVCGGTSMGASIREELTACLGSADQLKRLQQEGRVVEELW